MSDHRKFQGQARTETFDPQSIVDVSIVSLVRAIRNQEAEPLPCVECRAEIATLYLARQDQTQQATLSPEIAPEIAPGLAAVAAHLATCTICAAEYAALADTMTTFAVGLLPEMSDPPAFDLAFLRTSTPTPAPAPQPLWQTTLTPGTVTGGTVTGGIQSLFDAVQIRLSATGAAFASLRDYLQPASAVAWGSALRSDAAGSRAEIMMLPAPDADFSVQLAVGPMVAGQAAVALKFLKLATVKPIANLQVTLRNGQRQLLVGAMSGQDGSAHFERLSAGRYFLQVRYEQQLWEIPLVLIEEPTEDSCEDSGEASR